ncbi:MAG TPA: hypothetical protein PKE45_13240, partial [Caldilineaceae bacterium]|nr:hypothetical protein [Caldilineaceae bacterium]
VQTGDLTEDALVRALDELWQRRIVREQSTDLYDFSHDHIREVAYDAISPVRQRLLHRRVAQALETVHAMNLDAVSGQVAVHYEQAGLLEKAILYYKQASGVAQRIYAIVEAIDHLRKALRLLKSLPSTPERSQQELDIQLTLGPFLETLKGYAAPEVEQVYTRAQELCQQIGDRQPQQLIWALLGLRAHYFMRAEHGRAREVAEQLLTLVQSVHDPLLLAQAHRHLGTSLAHAGEFVRARVHLEQAIADHDDQQRSDQGMLYGRSPSVMSRSIAARTLWVLGYPDQAMQRIQEALNLAQDLSHPHDLAVALAFATQLHQYRREVEAAQTQAEATIILSTKHGYSFWLALGTMLRGWAFAEQEQSEVGMAQMRQGLAAAESIGIAWARPYFLGLLAEAHGRIGQVEAGLTLLAESLSLVEATQDHFWEAELYRLKGELLRRQATNRSGLSAVLTEAEMCFRQALEIARRQQAQSWALRAAMS